MLAALPTWPHSNAMHAKRSALASIQVYRHDMHDARGDQDEEERHVQGVPHPEPFLEDTELRYCPCRAQSLRNMVEGNALEALFLSGNGLVSRGRGLYHGVRATAHEALARPGASADHERGRDNGWTTPVAHSREAALFSIQTRDELGHDQNPAAALLDLVSGALQLGQGSRAVIGTAMQPGVQKASEEAAAGDQEHGEEGNVAVGRAETEAAVQENQHRGGDPQQDVPLEPRG